MTDLLPIVDVEEFLPVEFGHDMFMRQLPLRGEPRCGAEPPPEVRTEVMRTWPHDGISVCLLEPNHMPAGSTEYVHRALVVNPEEIVGSGPVLWWYQWVARRRLGQVVPD